MSLTADKQITSKASEIAAYPMADNVHLYKGALICANVSGYAVDGAATAGYACLGVAYENRDNTVSGHTAGGLNIRVQSGRTFLLGATGMSQAAVGQACFLVDDQTVGLAPQAEAIFVGIVRSYVSATSVWVYIPETDIGLALGGTLGSGNSAKTARIALAGTASGVFAAWANPETGPVWIERVIVSSQGTSGVIATAASSIDVGTTTVGATTGSDNLIDGLDVHSALITSDNPGKGAGANGKTGQELASGKWITVEDDGGGSAVGFAGELIISYRLL